MILTLFSPTGERWSLDPAPETGTEWATWLDTLRVSDRNAAAKALVLLRQAGKPPQAKCLLVSTTSGWQASLSDPLWSPYDYPFSCKICGNCFASRDNLITHRERKHSHLIPVFPLWDEKL